MGSHFLPQGIFPTQQSNLGLLCCRQILYCLSHYGSPLPLYGKMKTPALIEITPLICTSAVYGQHPVLSYPESPQGVHLRVATVADDLMMSIWFHPEFPQESPGQL